MPEQHTTMSTTQQTGTTQTEPTTQDKEAYNHRAKQALLPVNFAVLASLISEEKQRLVVDETSAQQVITHTQRLLLQTQSQRGEA